MSEAYIGEIRIFSYGRVPKDWMQCKGQILNIQQNMALFAILGNRFGGDGITTFGLPDLQGRAPMHWANIAELGTKGGEEVHALTLQEMPNHGHSVAAGTNGALISNPQGNVWSTLANGANLYHPSANSNMGATAIGPSGDNVPHNNMQPYSPANYCICVVGLYPPHP